MVYGIYPFKYNFQTKAGIDFQILHDREVLLRANVVNNGLYPLGYNLKFTGKAYLNDKIIFVSGEKSSNGLYLFSLCKEANSSSFFISYLEQLDSITFLKDETIGICGATSTPMWLMEDVAKRVKEHFQEK